MKYLITTSIILLSLYSTAVAQSNSQKDGPAKGLKTYLIEREIPGAGDLTAQQLQGISKQSCSVLKEMGPQIEWMHSYVTGDKVYCIYKAENEELIREHAEKGSFPVNKISLLSTKIGPETAN